MVKHLQENTITCPSCEAVMYTGTTCPECQYQDYGEPVTGETSADHLKANDNRKRTRSRKRAK